MTELAPRTQTIKYIGHGYNHSVRSAKKRDDRKECTVFANRRTDVRIGFSKLLHICVLAMLLLAGIQGVAGEFTTARSLATFAFGTKFCELEVLCTQSGGREGRRSRGQPAVRLQAPCLGKCIVLCAPTLSADHAITGRPKEVLDAHHGKQPEVHAHRCEGRQ